MNMNGMPGRGRDASSATVFLVVLVVLLTLWQLLLLSRPKPDHGAPAVAASPTLPVPARPGDTGNAASPPSPTPPASSAAPLAPDPEEDVASAVYRRVSPSVVSVANKALVSDFFGLEVYEIPQGAGSGFVWDTEGHIVSNFHVVHRASALSVTFPDGSSFEATLVGIDPGHDLAVLRVKAPAEKLVSVELGSSAALRVGQKAFAIGNPFGLDTSLSAGIVSALGRTMTAMNGQTIHEVIQTDAAINPGNSGGPLLDAAGRLIGVNTAIVSTSGGYAGVGFAVPSDTVRRIVPQLISRGRASRAGFGIRLVPDHLTRQSGVSGAAILQVVPGGAAERAGLRGVARDRGGRLRFGDVVTALDGSPVRSNDDLTALLDRMSVGDRARLTCRRDGRDREVEVTLHDLDD